MICGIKRGIVAHHITYAEPNALSLKVGDNWTVPLCNGHHLELHALGNERVFWALAGIEILDHARQLYDGYVSGGGSREN